mmetsp:Transcript_58479/g.181621  ORF Transcript_58479/g.181621 Transcript_58479/m.181621 type:complete len:399 (+) Transcript_58479:54-1250(+)
MPRFASWAAEESVAALPPPPQKVPFMVHNRNLTTKSDGIVYRLSPDMDKKASKLAKFMTIVHGVPYNLDWVEVDGLFLPMRVNDKDVLERLEVSTIQEDAILPPTEEARKIFPWLKVEKVVEDDSVPVARQQVVPQTVKDFRLAGPTSARDSQGEWYEVVAERAVMRSAPGPDAHIENIKLSGEFVELFEWDPHKEWRRCKDSWQPGWMRIRHEQHGKLLRPVDEVIIELVEPMCRSLMINDFKALQEWTKQVSRRELNRLGPGALNMAAARGYLDSLVVLVEAGVDASGIVKAGAKLAGSGFREPAATRALASAMMGLDFSVLDFEGALKKLVPQTKTLAETTWERAIGNRHAATRSMAEEPEPLRGALARKEANSSGRRRREGGSKDLGFLSEDSN